MSFTSRTCNARLSNSPFVSGAMTHTASLSRISSRNSDNSSEAEPTIRRRHPPGPLGLADRAGALRE